MMPRELGFSSSEVNFFALLNYFTENIQEPLFLWQLRNELASPSYAKDTYQWCWSAQHRATFYAVGEAIGSRLCPAWGPHLNIQLLRKQPAAHSTGNTTSSSENLTYKENNDSIFSLIKKKKDQILHHLVQLYLLMWQKSKKSCLERKSSNSFSLSILWFTITICQSTELCTEELILYVLMRTYTVKCYLTLEDKFKVLTQNYQVIVHLSGYCARCDSS